MKENAVIMKELKAIIGVKRQHQGFSLIELMIAISILAILVGIAAPSVTEVMLNARMTGQVNDLLVDLATARSEAVKRNVRTSICTSNNNGASCTGSAWGEGWMVFADDNANGRRAGAEIVIKTTPALQPGNTLVVAGDSATGAGGARFVPYLPSGVSTPGGAVTFTMCDARTTANAGRIITISTTGRASVARTTC